MMTASLYLVQDYRSRYKVLTNAGKIGFMNFHTIARQLRQSILIY